MKNFVAFLALSLGWPCGVHAADFFEGKFGPGQFVLQGRVDNKPAEMNGVHFTVSDYLGADHTVPLEADGTFSALFPVTDIQDIVFHLPGTSVTLFTFPGDSITVGFDARDPGASFRAEGNSAERTRELELGVQLSRKYGNLFWYFYVDGHTTAEPEMVAELISRYGDYTRTVTAFIEENGSVPGARKFMEDGYYAMARMACGVNIPLACLPYDNPWDPVWETDESEFGYIREEMRQFVLDKHVYFYSRRPYQRLDYNTFRYSGQYRDFLDSYFLLSFFYYIEGYDDFEWVSPIKQIYHGCLAQIPIDPVRDWILTRRIESAFSNDDFREVESVYLDYKKINTNEEYARLLEERYLTARSLHASEYAPDFELEDMKGNTVRLSDFRGRVVYLDFWSVSCAPCLDEFKNAVPLLKERYSDSDVVYIYICSESGREAWKRVVERFALDGVHLFAEGGKAGNPIFTEYNVQGFPHYVLIDRQGRIEEHYSLRPSDILDEGEASSFHRLATSGR